MATSIPPHNAAELLDAAIALIDWKPSKKTPFALSLSKGASREPDAGGEAGLDGLSPNGNDSEVEDFDILAFVKGPDFPTGGFVVDSAAAIAEAYATGRGGFRVRARWHVEDQGRGTWIAVVNEIPYGVQKGKLIEQIADLINDKKLPILADVRDESDSEIRIVIEPRSRTVDADMLMESLFRMSDLESRVSLNLNVLDATRTPRVMSLRDALSAWVDHQFVVLQRRSQHRLDKIADRLELVGGYIIAFLNLDRVIHIIRTEDEPKPVMIAEFELTDRQAEAILNMRLRSLRRLEEMELRKEQAALEKERGELELLLGSDARQRTRLKRDMGKLRDRYGPETLLGKRRTTIEEAGPPRDIPLEAMIDKEPITVIMSQRGWVRAMKGHVDLAAADTLKFKEGDGPAFAFHAQTTDKILLAVDNGRFYTLAADKLPGGRGFGEPVRLMIDMDGEHDIVGLLPASSAEKLLVAASDGRGFVIKAADTIAETRKGKTVVTPRKGAKLAMVRPIAPTHDYVAAVGDNRRLLVFPLAELAELSRGQGVQLQRYRDGGLSDAITFVFAEGISWAMGGDSGRTRTESDMNAWRAARGAAGRMPPTGFPRDNRF
ncbi:DNA topoisomerase IV subunit A [Sphingomonas koreensis]|nr:DNA topoisomerase IV subunit A [Sphingomonas koreensis]